VKRAGPVRQIAFVTIDIVGGYCKEINIRQTEDGFAAKLNG
jgi:hypothetical protein